MKALAFVAGLGILAAGAIGMIMPSALVWVTQRFGRQHIGRHCVKDAAVDSALDVDSIVK